MERILEFLREAKTYFLATEEGDSPKVRPFGTIDLYNGGLYFQTGRKKEVYRQLKANPNVEICAVLGGEWLRVAAKAVEENDIEAEKHLLAAYPELGGMYAPGDGNNVVFRLESGRATFSSFSKAPETLDF